MSASVSIDFFTSMPLQERAKQLALAVRDELQMTITWLKGRYLEMLRVSRPISVQASMTGECRLKAERTTQLATASDLVIGFCEFYNMSRKNSWYGKCYSAEMHMSFIVTRESTGYLPTEHSALRSSPSAPSITAACISLTSARSGNGLKTILSKNCEASMTGFALQLHNLMIFFQIQLIFSIGKTVPSQPRGTKTASQTSKIWLMSLMAASFSSFAMIRTSGLTQRSPIAIASQCIISFSSTISQWPQLTE